VFAVLQIWSSEVEALRLELIAAKEACQDAKNEREIMEFSVRKASRNLREAFEEFWAASGPFIDLGSLDFAFSAGGALGAAMLDYDYATDSIYGRDEFGFSNQ